MDTLKEAMKLINESIKGKGPWDIGDREAFVFNDAVAVVSMNEGRELKIDITAGIPVKFDLNLELTEPCIRKC